MADISKITTLDGTTYDIKDITARQQIPWAIVDSTSTSTVFTATVPGITKLESGVFCIIMNNKVTSASGCTININSLGAKPMYTTNAVATRVTTNFAKDVTWGLVYNEERVEGGCWDLVYLYNSNTTYNTMAGLNHGYGFLLDSKLYRYQMVFQIDHDTVTPLNNNSNTTGKTKTMLTDVEFNPFGEILYYYTTTAIEAGARLGSANAQFMYSGVDLRYTFNCGNDTLTARKPIYLKVLMQTNGKCKLASANPLAQDLPTANDGCHYIFLGMMYSTYQMTLWPHHPVYYHDGTKLRQSFQYDAEFSGNYADLTNRPSINGITLSGNKTAADLSLGTYTKPSDGIPATDMTTAVQNYLDIVGDLALDEYDTHTGKVPRVHSVINDYVSSWDFVNLGGEIEYVTGNVVRIAQAEENTTYVCGECNALMITLPGTGVVNLVFKSGSTPTELYVTSSGTVNWPDGFNPNSLEANRLYQISFLCTDSNNPNTADDVYAKILNPSASDVGAIAAPSSPATGSFLVYNGTSWVAQTLSTWQGGSY